MDSVQLEFLMATSWYVFYTLIVTRGVAKGEGRGYAPSITNICYPLKLATWLQIS